MRSRHNVPSLAIQIPWAQAGTQTLTQKTYREIGQRIAKAMLRKGG
jgi:hypothetical protein